MDLIFKYNKVIKNTEITDDILYIYYKTILLNMK